MNSLKSLCVMVLTKSKKVKTPSEASASIMECNRTPGLEPASNQEVGVPRAIFSPHTNSLPFEERRVTVEQAVKIGRNVYRATPSATNTIFECRVLSRHHATLYYDKGHFYLVDNQSSNGTFVNNSRCSLSKEPHEVFSGDLVQFGIPVVENVGNTEKNTFPPVIALLKLYHPDGREAKLSVTTTMTTPLHLEEIYQLNNFVQEAIQREAALESRLRTLRECVEKTRAEAAASWELFVGEQRLLMRVHTLEHMLAAGRAPEQHHIADLLTDKRNYQEVALESLRTAHEQRLALEEKVERRNREVAALHHHNYALRMAANNALQELQKLATRCERKLCAARLAIAAAEDRELTLRKHLPLAYSVQNGEAKILVVCTDSNKLQEAKKGGSLEDAVLSLPDYIKLLLPQNLLNKVGIKSITADGKSPKEIELILKSNNFNSDNLEIKTESENVVEAKPNDTDSCTDDEKNSRLNNDAGHETESSSNLDGEMAPDNNANSKFNDSDSKEDSGKAAVEMANILRVMGGLNEEIRVLRERVAACGAENAQLRAARDELLAAGDVRDTDAEDAVAVRARLADLQEQLARSTVAEEANIAEIQRLASSAAEMQAELAFRPTRADVDDLTSVIGKLREDLLEREKTIEYLEMTIERKNTGIDKAVETSASLEDLREEKLDAKRISEEIDEIFQLNYDDDEETDSVATEINVASDQSDEYVRLDDEKRLEVTLNNGTLHALEEELVRVKESWEAVNAERARLAAQLARRQGPDITRYLVVALPILAALLVWFLQPQAS
ncbi:sarcolemmal membrane-associated protein isoform X2 [Aricia agestis]|uniref:sarcolemmal membrane-associated protein isoform X2 n=1 Tax=Aricia agestis TaxID=91739 RepID=UPI001C20967D|nr:sarcolemmal membrane-associated protein isoform X2 [Aricia agestis]